MHTTFAGTVLSKPRRLSAAPLVAIVEWLLRRDEAFRSRARLLSMSNHMLRDIGLTHDLIDDALRGNINRN